MARICMMESSAALMRASSIAPINSSSSTSSPCRMVLPTGLRNWSRSRARNSVLWLGYERSTRSIQSSSTFSLHGTAMGGSLDAAGRLGQPGELAGALGRARREQRVNLVQLESRLFAQLADHGCDAELQVVIAQVVDHLPVILGERLDSFAGREI